MELPIHVLQMYGYLLLFAWVLIEQFGIPLPATPVLLAAGALSAEGQISFSTGTCGRHRGFRYWPTAPGSSLAAGTATTSCAFFASSLLNRPPVCAARRTRSAAAAPPRS